MIRASFLKRKTVDDNSGFTLVEALLALLVFTVGILATASLQSTSLTSEVLSRQNTEASSLAASVIEDLHPLNYEKDAELANGTTALPVQDEYNISYNVQRDAIIDNTMLIQVTVNWTVGGVQKTISFISIKPDII